LQILSAANQSPEILDSSAIDTAFAVDNADSLFSNNGGAYVAFSELGGPNAPIGDCLSFDWGLPFFYGKSVFTGIEQQPVTGTTVVGPFWAY
jgi:hypothetical protein